MTSSPLLSLRGLGSRFGGLVAVDDVNFDLPPSVLWLRTFQFFMGGIGVIPLHKQIKRQACISELAPCGFIRRHAVLFHQ